MARNTRKVKTYAITSDTSFEDFISLSIIDAGATDGFQVKGGGSDSVWISIPTGIPYNIGKDDGSLIEKLFVKAATGKSLNISASVLY